MAQPCHFERAVAVTRAVHNHSAGFFVSAPGQDPRQQGRKLARQTRVDPDGKRRYGSMSFAQSNAQSHVGETCPGSLMFSLKDVSKIYRTGDIETTALDEVTLDISSGEFISIMGPSGCGKSTLLNIIGLLDSPTSGDYFILGENVARANEARLSQIRKDTVGFIFQSFNLIQELSVAENVELALLYHKLPATERRARVTSALERMQIAHRAEHRPAQLSGGQQQRVAIARALVSNPKLILADEPTGNLDSSHGEDVMRLLTELNGEGATIIMVTHSHSHAAYASRIVNLFDGQVVAENFLEARAV